MKIGSLYVELGVNDNKATATLSQFSIAMTGAVAAGGLIVKGLEKAIEKFQKLADNAMRAAVAIEMFEAQTGLSGQEMQQWDIAAQQAGISAGTLSANLISLQSNINDIKLGAGNIKPYQLMGINPVGMSPTQLLESMRGFYQAMNDKSMASNILKSAGVSPEMLVLLKKTNAELKSMVSVPFLSDAQRDKLLNLHKAFVNFNQVIQATTNIFIATAGPALVKIFTVLSLAISHFAGILSVCVSKITVFHTALGGLILWITRAAWGSAITNLIANPIAQIIAAILAVFLLLDDLYVYFNGGQSITGDAIKGIEKLFMSMAGWIDKAVASLDRLLERFTGVKVMADVLQAMGSVLTPLADPVGTLKSGAMNTIHLTQYITGTDAKTVADHATAGVKTVLTDANIDSAAQQTNPKGR